MTSFKKFFYILYLPLSLCAHTPTKESTVLHRKQLQELISPSCVALPEGGFVYYFHPDLFPWLEKPLTSQTVQTLRQKLSPHLQIPFSKEGFTKASSRRDDGEIDETNYSAIWVRDASWHYFGLKITNKMDAKRLIMNLLRFYSSEEQINRFLTVIASPQIANPQCNANAHMDVPLIRFSGQSLSHHQVEGSDQEWNHLQFDSHGLFLLAISDAVRSNIISAEDLNEKSYEILSLFPAFFTQTKYWERTDAGPWEEELIPNASTVGLIAAGLREYQNTLLKNITIKQQLDLIAKKNGTVIASSLCPQHIEMLFQKGLAKVEYNLSLGGEAPDLSGKEINRNADAALLFLCYPDQALFADNSEKTQTILNITLGLVGPYGVYRYKNDAYQALNYWINYDIPSAIGGEKTVDLKIATRFEKGYMPSNQPYDAQWFFDSIFAGVYYNLSLITHDQTLQKYYLQRGDVHLKRALGQFTGPNTYAANGEKLMPMSLPESINTVFDANYLFKPMPSPICPLGWSVATMQMALEKAEKAHQCYEIQ